VELLAPAAGLIDSMRGLCLRGTSPLEAWYHAGALVGGLNSSQVIVAGDTLFAQPLWVAEAMTLDRLAVNVSTGASGALARFGVYTAAVTGNLYPDALLFDAGEVDAGTSGVKSVTVNLNLAGGRLYWLAMMKNATGSAWFRCTNLAWAVDVLGVLSTLPTTGAQGLSVAQTYGALPATFPSGGAPRSGTTPQVFFRLAA
jgi:hypothetical protein